MTRKQLAEELYDLNVKKGICGNPNGCGKAEWVRRTLFGCGSCAPARKDELERAIAWAKEDLQIK